MYANQLIIITGGSSGLGSALAQRFVADGANVALVARDPKKLAAVKADLAKNLSTKQKVESFSCDVSDESACAKTLAAIVGKMGSPDMLINSAGILKEGYFDDLPMSTFRDVMDINFFGVLHCIRATLPYFNKAGRGRIVNIASMAGKVGTFGLTAYCASKHALVGYTDALRGELAPRHIEVQLVCPGEFDTPMVHGIEDSRTPENRAITHTVPPLGLEQVADEVYAGIAKRQFMIIPGRITRVVEAINRIIPGVMRKMLDHKLKSIYVGPNR